MNGETPLIQSTQPSQLISDAYRKEQEMLHLLPGYGAMGEEFAPMVAQIIKQFQVNHLLDYGCGHNLGLWKGLKPHLKGLPYKITYQAYDPGVPQYAGAPVPAQMVACCDVLEHIEPEFLDNVLDDIKRVTQAILFATIATGPAVKKLSDGRNAHLIQEDIDFWMPKLWERFDIQSVVRQKGGFLVVAYSKPGALIET